MGQCVARVTEELASQMHHTLNRGWFNCAAFPSLSECMWNWYLQIGCPQSDVLVCFLVRKYISLFLQCFMLYIILGGARHTTHRKWGVTFLRGYFRNVVHFIFQMTRPVLMESLTRDFVLVCRLKRCTKRPTLRFVRIPSTKRKHQGRSRRRGKNNDTRQSNCLVY